MNTEDMRARAVDIAEMVAGKVSETLATASELTKMGVEAAKPHVMHAADATVKAAAPLVDSAVAGTAKMTERAGEGLHRVHQDLVADYLPRIESVVEEAAKRAAIPAAATAAAVEAAKPKKRHRCRKAALWTLGVAGVAGVGYLLWRRSRPIEDPWAEEYWTDLETDIDLSGLPDESVMDEAPTADGAQEEKEKKDEA